MKIVLDTNVFVSGVFFGGPPGEILEAWHAGRVQVVVSLEILDEYERVGRELAGKYNAIDLDPILQYLAVNAEICECPPLTEQVCEDADDDKFLACALAAKASAIVTGDKLLLKVTGFAGIEVIRPREFIDQYLTN